MIINFSLAFILESQNYYCKIRDYICCKFNWKPKLFKKFHYNYKPSHGLFLRSDC